MAIIKIEGLESDTYECEDCGTSYASGFNVTIDGEPFGNFKPYAHCYDGSTYEIEDVMRALLEHFGHEVEVTW